MDIERELRNKSGYTLPDIDNAIAEYEEHDLLGDRKQTLTQIGQKGLDLRTRM